MTTKGEIVEFEWDTGNIDKNFEKHGITANEAEEVFISEDAYAEPDVKHSKKEARYILLGMSRSNHKLFVVFTMRGTKIRIISARRMHGREVQKYEKAQKNSNV